MASPANQSKPPAAPADHVLVIERVFDAPRSLVFQAWTEPRHLLNWCAPHGFTVTEAVGELRPGGRWRSAMRSPDGEALRLGGVYREIVPDERLVFTHAWDEADGGPGHETLVTVTLADVATGRTAMTFRQEFFKSAATRDGHRSGWTQGFERLAAYLAAGAPG